MILGKIDRRRPEPDDVGAVGFHDLDRADRIAQRLGHFHALGVHREAVGQHRLVRRAAAGAAAFEQAGLEPAVMLVAAFERSEEHTSELQSLMRISYAVFCLKKKRKNMKLT